MKRQVLLMCVLYLMTFNVVHDMLNVKSANFAHLVYSL